MESKDLAVYNTAETSMVLDVNIPGLDEMGRADMILPRVRIVQAQSDFSEDVGELYNSLMNTSKPFVNCVVIGVKIGRVRWPSVFQRGQDPLCASDDGITARAGLVGITATGEETTDCNLCVYSHWAGGTPPACAQFYNFLCLDVDEGDVPFLVSFGRTSTRAGKQLITLLKSQRLSKTFVISTAQEKNDKGKYYTLTVKSGDPLPRDRQAYYASQMRAFSGVAITTDIEASPNMMADDVPF